MNFWQAVLRAALSLLESLLPGVPVPVPGPPAPNPGPPVTLSPLAQVILAYNNSHSFFALSSTWTIPEKGVIIHKITPDQAEAIATQITAVTSSKAYPITFLLACLGVESVLDPLCQNGNLGPGESNAGNPNNLGGYDMGVGQFKLEDLVGNAGLTTVLAAQAFAFDVGRAIPYHVEVMQTKIAVAKTVIAQNTSSDPDSRLNNFYLYATGAYNFGSTGMLAVYESGQFPTHCASVLSDEQYFAGKLGVPSIFAGLT